MKKQLPTEPLRPGSAFSKLDLSTHRSFVSICEVVSDEKVISCRF